MGGNPVVTVLIFFLCFSVLVRKTSYNLQGNVRVGLFGPQPNPLLHGHSLGCSMACHYIYKHLFVLRVSVCMHEYVSGVMHVYIFYARLSLHPLECCVTF